MLSNLRLDLRHCLIARILSYIAEGMKDSSTLGRYSYPGRNPHRYDRDHLDRIDLAIELGW